ncbi:MAG: acyltransferase [Clostridia bacterium]|nr:acyltransferase [Clostridia bacterium]
MNVKKRNNSIDLFRYVCALLVVIIHTEPFYGGELRGLGIFLKEFLSRIAVPFFFAVSGYFLFLKIDRDGKAPLRSAWRLTKVYLFWSIPYLLLNLWVLRNDIPSFHSRTVSDLFLHGSSSHFWFFPALIYATLLIALIYKAFGWKPLAVTAVVLYIIGVIGSSYTPLGMQIPGLSVLYGWEHFAAVRPSL